MFEFLKNLGFKSKSYEMPEITDNHQMEIIRSKAASAPQFDKMSDFMDHMFDETKPVENPVIGILEDPSMKLEGDSVSGIRDNWGVINPKGRRDFGG